MSEQLVPKLKKMGIDEHKFGILLQQLAQLTDMPASLIGERALELAENLKPGESLDVHKVLKIATKDLINASKPAQVKSEPQPDKLLMEKDLKAERLEYMRKVAEQEKLINIIAGGGAEKTFKNYSR